MMNTINSNDYMLQSNLSQSLVVLYVVSGLASSEVLWGVGIVSSQVFWIQTEACVIPS